MTDQTHIPFGFVVDVIECLERNNQPVEPILMAAGIDAERGTDVPISRYAKLLDEAVRCLDDEFLGLGARPMRPGGFYLLCHATVHAPDLRSALRRILRFLNVVLEDPCAELVTEPGRAIIRLNDANGPRSAFTYRTYYLLVLGLACWLVGRRFPLLDVQFSCGEPVRKDDYAFFFGAPVKFGQEHTALLFDAAQLNLPLVRSSKSLKNFLRLAPANLLIRHRHGPNLSERVRTVLTETDCAAWLGFDDMARQHRMSPATMRRWLKQEGQSYGNLKDEIRLKRAQLLLRTTDMPVAEIAHVLGYSEPSAFHRAFAKWVGKTPGQYRLS